MRSFTNLPPNNSKLIVSYNGTNEVHLTFIYLFEVSAATKVDASKTLVTYVIQSSRVGETIYHGALVMTLHQNNENETSKYVLQRQQQNHRRIQA